MDLEDIFQVKGYLQLGDRHKLFAESKKLLDIPDEKIREEDVKLAARIFDALGDHIEIEGANFTCPVMSIHFTDSLSNKFRKYFIFNENTSYKTYAERRSEEKS